MFMNYFDMNAHPFTAGEYRPDPRANRYWEIFTFEIVQGIVAEQQISSPDFTSDACQPQFFFTYDRDETRGVSKTRQRPFVSSDHRKAYPK